MSLCISFPQCVTRSSENVQWGLVLWFYGQTCDDYWISLCAVSQMRFFLKYKLVFAVDQFSFAT